MKTNRTIRFLALLLCVVMVVGMLPVTALAARMEDNEVAIAAPEAEAVSQEAPKYQAAASAAQPAATLSEGEDSGDAVTYKYVLAENGPVDGGVYAIFSHRDTANELTANRVLYYDGTSALTAQVEATAISSDSKTLTLDDTNYAVETQLWEAVAVDGGMALKSLAGNADKYMELSLTDNAGHAQVKLNSAPQALTISSSTVSGRTGFKILQSAGTTTCSINWSGGAYYTHNADNGFPVRFYKRTVVKPEYTPAQAIEKGSTVYFFAKASGNGWQFYSNEEASLPSGRTVAMHDTSNNNYTAASLAAGTYRISDGASTRNYCGPFDAVGARITGQGQNPNTAYNFTFAVDEDSAYANAFTIQENGQSTNLYLTTTSGSYKHSNGSDWSGVELGAESATFYVTQRDENTANFWIWYEVPAEVEDPTPDPRTPQDAIDEGYDVNYLTWYNSVADSTVGTGWELLKNSPVAVTVQDSTGAAVTEGFAEGEKYRVAYKSNYYLYAPFSTTGATNTTAKGGYVANYSDFKLIPVNGSNGGYLVQSVQDPTLYMTSTVVDFTFQSNDWKGIQFSTTGSTFYFTPVNGQNDGTYYLWCETEKATTPVDPTPTDPVTQTYASPEEAVAAGKIVTYLGMTPNVTDSARRWDGVSEANRLGIDLYQADGDPSAATTATAITKDIDGVDSGKGYLIYMPDSAKTAMMHYNSNGDLTNQCQNVQSTISNHMEHLFIIEFENGGYTIRPYNVADKYLSLAVTGSQQTFKSEKTIFYITPAENAADGGTYYIWTATDPVLGASKSVMLESSGTDNASNSWAFVGGRAAQGTFEDIKLSRTVAGHFEEYIRWEKTDGSGDAPNTKRQRFVTNTAYDGQTLADIVSTAGWKRVTDLDPRAAVYMVEAVDAADDDFADDLAEFVRKATALRSNTGFAVIIKGYNAATAAKNSAVDTVANAATFKNRVVVVDPGLLEADQLAASGYPNAKGHLAIAQKLAEVVVGTTNNFPTSKNDAAAIADSRWADRLTTEGVTIFGSATAEADLTDAQKAIKAKMNAGAMTWLFMGDSITHGALWAEGEGTLSQNFETFIKDDLGRKSDIIVNTAVSNATSLSTKNAITERLNNYDPDVVSIMIGTNDESGKQVSVADYKTHLTTIINAILAKDAIAVLRTPIPNAASGRGNNNWEYVAAMKEVYNNLSAAQQAKVILIDQFAEWWPYLMTSEKGVGTTFLFNQVFTQNTNGVHPGPVGHLWMTQEFISGLGLWDDSKNLCKLSYASANNWNITPESGDLTGKYDYTVATKTFSIDASALADGTVISAEVTVGGETKTYLNGDPATLTFDLSGVAASTVDVKVTALVSASATSGEKITFSTVNLNLNEEVESKESAPAPVYQYRLSTGPIQEGSNYTIVGTTVENDTARARAMHFWYNNSNVLKVDQCQIDANDTIGSATLTSVDESYHLVTAVASGSGFKFQVTAGNAKGKFLAASASGLSLDDTGTVFTFTALTGGGYNMGFDDNGTTRYVAWDNNTSVKNWITSTTPYKVNLYRNVEMTTATANTTITGTGTRPMDPENPVTYYRIPSLVTLSNGWLMATSDIRWFSTNDSPSNLDTIVSISKDGGQTWAYEVVNYFSDYAPIRGTGASYGPAKDGSASFIDPAVVQSPTTGKIYLLVDVQPPYCNGGKIGTGFDSQGRLLISKSPVNSGYSMNNTHNSNLNGYTFDYYVDINRAASAETVSVNGADMKLWPICANDGDKKTGYYVDAFFNTYYDYGTKDAANVKPVIAVQHDSIETIHNNIFYTQSEWKAYPTAFLMVRSAEVVGDKLVWSEPKLLNDQIKLEGEHFIGVCPGRGITTTVTGADGQPVERIIFPVYDSYDGNDADYHELASTIYSDDGGVTWHRGERTPGIPVNDTGKTSESQIVELPDGNGGTFLRMFSRNGRPTISYADSHDGGHTWSVPVRDSALNADNQNSQGCMVSFINVKGFLIGPDGTIYENLVLASYPQGTANGGSAKRTNGTIRIGWYDEVNGGAINWLNEEKTWFAGSYIYSCLTQRLEGDAQNGAPSDNFALLYETDLGQNSSGNFTDLRFTTFDLHDILGDNWTLVQTKPSQADIPAITVDESLVELDLGEDATYDLNGIVAVTPAAATVTWASDNEAVATVANGVVTVVSAGKAHITVTATNLNVTVTAKIEIVVQDGADNVTLPDAYENPGIVTTTITEDGTKYELDTDGDLSGVYAISPATGRRVALHGGTTTDQCGATFSGNELTISHADDTWTVTKQADGTYTIRANNGNYLTSTTSGVQLALSSTAEAFTITHVGNGVYNVRSAGGQYLNFPDSSTAKWNMDAAAFGIQFFEKVDYVAGDTYTVSAAGLEAAIAAFNENRDDYAEVLALAKDYLSSRQARAAQERIDAATKALYARVTMGVADVYTVDAIADQTYTGEAIVPAITVRKNGLAITSGFTTAIANNVEEGEATVTVTVGSQVITATFTIVAGQTEPEDTLEYAVEAIPDYVYNGAALTPAVIVTVSKNGGEPEVILDGYEVTYANNTAVGTATVTITVDGEQVASATFRILAATAPSTSGGSTGGSSAVTTPVEDLDDPDVPLVEDPTEDLDDPDVPLADLPLTFIDVRENDWFYAAVKFSVASSLMQGVSAQTFSPNENTTRGMIVTILHRLEKEPNTDVTAAFSDVSGSEWYADGIAWGQSTGVATGVGNGAFLPNQDVTREQLVVFLYRFAQYKGWDVTASADITGFLDGATTSDWAVEAMNWAVGVGLVQGKGQYRLDPTGTATRAESAAILMRFCEQFTK